MSNTLLEFRKILAEGGQEYTPDEAARLYLVALDLVDRAKQISQTDLWKMLDMDVEGLSPEEKRDSLELLQHAREAS